MQPNPVVSEQVRTDVNAAKVEVVVVPTYKPQLTGTEERVLRHALQVLHRHDTCFVALTQLALVCRRTSRLRIYTLDAANIVAVSPAYCPMKFELLAFVAPEPAVAPMKFELLALVAL